MKVSLEHPKKSELESVKADLKLFHQANPKGSMSITQKKQSCNLNHTNI